MFEPQNFCQFHSVYRVLGGVVCFVVQGTKIIRFVFRHPIWITGSGIKFDLKIAFPFPWSLFSYVLQVSWAESGARTVLFVGFQRTFSFGKEFSILIRDVHPCYRLARWQMLLSRFSGFRWNSNSTSSLKGCCSWCLIKLIN